MQVLTVCLAFVVARFQAADGAMFADFRGLTVKDATELRRTLRGASASFSVVKNTLSRLAAYPTTTWNGTTVYAMAENINGSTDPTALFKPGDQPINMEGSVFPGENLFVGGDAAQLQIARDTLQQMNSWGVTTGQNKNNGFPKEFPIAARVGWPAADLVGKLDAAVKAQSRATNLTVAQSGGGIETSGTIEAVDSMLMQSVSGTIRLFGDADWPTTKDAHFIRLRAKGAFTVSAALAGGTVSPVTVTSDVGGAVRLKDPWPAGPVTVSRLDANGNAVATVAHTVTDGVIAFDTAAGTTYRVRPGAAPEPGPGGGLPVTGTAVRPMALTGVLLVVLGVAAVIAARRRRRGSSD